MSREFMLQVISIALGISGFLIGYCLGFDHARRKLSMLSAKLFTDLFNKLGMDPKTEIDRLIDENLQSK